MHQTGVFLLSLLLLFLFHLPLLGSMNRLCLWKGNVGREHARDANHDEHVFLHIDFQIDQSVEAAVPAAKWKRLPAAFG